MNHWLRNFILMALMLAASGMAVALRPTHKIADERPPIDLKTLIPVQFGDWREETRNASFVVNPQQTESLGQIYSETLSRTYENAKGYRVMLSIAYGANQSRELQVHRPEVCYSAQGFQLRSTTKDNLTIGNTTLPVMRILASQDSRVEPITYWVMIGETPVRGNLEQGFARLRYGLQGLIPDGMLIRVSTISDDTASAYEVQDQFIRQMLEQLVPESRHRFAGF